MKHIATAPLAYRSRRRRRRSLAAYGFPYPPTTRTITRQGSTRNDAYTYNNRSELIGDVVDGSGLNGWDYDNIGNRRMEHRSDGYEIYTANQLNQYTAIEEAEGTFTPTYDADGNQTRVKTSTGIWNVTYNAKNRPILFTKDDNSVSVECTYDYMGRRATKKVTINGIVTLHQRYLYRGYLQIACCDLLRSNEPCLWLITWDPTQPIATRPLAVQKDGTWYTYGWDLSKNVWEVFGSAGYIRTTYSYSPVGKIKTTGEFEQPLQWRSELYDSYIGLNYFNYRYYNSSDASWLSRDPISIFASLNLYRYCMNAFYELDVLGLAKGLKGFKAFIMEIVGDKLVKRGFIKSEEVAASMVRRGKDIYICNGEEAARKFAQKVAKGKIIHDPPHKPGYYYHFHTKRTHGHPHIFYNIIGGTIITRAAGIAEAKEECEFDVSLDKYVAINQPYSPALNQYVLSNIMENKELAAILDFFNPWEILAIAEEVIGEILRDESIETVGYSVKITTKSTNKVVYSMFLDINGNPSSDPIINLPYWFHKYEQTNGKISPEAEFGTVYYNILKFINESIQ